MKTAAKGDDVRLVFPEVRARPFAGELDRRFVAFGAAILEMHPICKRGGVHQTLGQAHHGFGEVEVRIVQGAGGRFLEGGKDVGVAVSQGIDGNTRHQVQVAIAIGVLQPGAMPPGQHKGSAAIGLDEVTLVEFGNGMHR